LNKAGSVERRSAIEALGVSKIFGNGDDAVRALDNIDVTIRENHGGSTFIVRLQNRRAGTVPFKVGAKVGVRIDDNAAQVLRD